MTKRLPVLTVLATAWLLTACPPPYKDTDAVYDQALMIPDVDMEVEDELDFKKGDKIDWKRLNILSDGKAALTVIVGNPFQNDHRLEGEIAVFMPNGDEVTKTAIVPGEANYKLTWDVAADDMYLVRLTTNKGKAPYKIKYEVSEPERDPCADITCGAGLKCVDGDCVPSDPNVCVPACSSSLICWNNECITPCDGKCPRGTVCDKSANECVKDPCYGKRCGSGEYCYRGSCVKKRTNPCDSCRKGQKCVSGKCVDAEAPAGPIPATVVQVIAEGNKSWLVLNKGKTHGVKVGQTGSLKGVGRFTIKKVYGFRCRALINKSTAQIGNNKNAVIKP